MNVSLISRRAVLHQLEASRGRLTYPAFQQAAEAACQQLMASFPGGLWIDSFAETPLWLAAKRMVARGEMACAGGNLFVAVGAETPAP